jgi:hypothetical protein
VTIVTIVTIETIENYRKPQKLSIRLAKILKTKNTQKENEQKR